MLKKEKIILAVKAPPDKKIFSDIKRAGLGAVEIYLSEDALGNLNNIVDLCNNFSFSYAVHAPNRGHNPSDLSKFVNAINAQVVVFHNIYWEDEWEKIVNIFKDSTAKLCIENTYSVHEPLKFMRRYGFGKCLDMEHLQLECAGVYEEEFIRTIKDASHIHLTGYFYGSQLWHTHIHHSPEHNLYLLNLIRNTGYSGFVVSEARASLQNYEEFKKLSDFLKNN